LVIKHAEVEVSDQHRIKLHAQRTMGHKLPKLPYSARNFNMAERETSGWDSKVQIKERV